MPGFTQYATATAKTQNYLAATVFIRFVLSQLTMEGIIAI